EVISGFEHGQDDFPATFIGRHHTGTAGEQDEQGVGLAPALHNQLTTTIAAFDHPLGDGLGLDCRQHREQWDPADQVKVGQHGHGSSSLTRKQGERSPWLVRTTTCLYNFRLCAVILGTLSKLSAGQARRYPGNTSQFSTRKCLMSSSQHSNVLILGS